MTPRVALASLTLLAGCASQPTPAPRPAGAPSAGGPSQSAVPDGPTDPRCGPPTSAERLVVPAGETARTSFGIAVTYEGSEHDSFDGGGSDAAVRMVFQGVLDDGSLTPSALGWRPSLEASPRWVHLPMAICVRLVDATELQATVDVLRARK